jgi:hypothetical protein
MSLIVGLPNTVAALVLIASFVAVAIPWQAFLPIYALLLSGNWVRR